MEPKIANSFCAEDGIVAYKNMGKKTINNCHIEIMNMAL